MEFPCALVNVMSEKGKLRDMTFTLLKATVWIEVVCCCVLILCGLLVNTAQDVMCIFVNQ